MKLTLRYLASVLATLVTFMNLYMYFGGYSTYTKKEGAEKQHYNIQQYSKKLQAILSPGYVAKDHIHSIANHSLDAEPALTSVHDITETDDDRKLSHAHDNNEGQVRSEEEDKDDAESDKLNSPLNIEDEQFIAVDTNEKSNKSSLASSVNGPKTRSNDQIPKTINSTNKPWRTEYDKIVNPHNFHYKINEEKICASKTDIIVFIISATDHSTQRLLIRQAWAGEKTVNGFAIKVVFLMGDSGKLTINHAIQEESAIYGDIIQETFMDTYRNLTLKTIMGLKWVTNFCPDARYILKCDDDIFVNVFQLVRHLKVFEKQGRDKNLILCNIDTGNRSHVIRDSSSKWYVTSEEFPGDHYPTYCDGPVYLLATNVGKALYNASLYQPLFWLEDVYTTGFLADKLGMEHTEFSSLYAYVPQWFTFDIFVSFIVKQYVFVICKSTQHITELWMILEQYQRNNIHEKRLLYQPMELRNAAVAREKERFKNYKYYLWKLR
ncbi:unnamed protein product [Owenia fusiformis]|uniref:Hexosyltransferase n=1 Tax=Owenia fusiformis TaxID=6347 RepID=A0A8J1TYK4_OWEFU|nr:unnamed protein product [Owenia fusiformis]